MGAGKQRQPVPARAEAARAKLRVLFVCYGNSCRSPMAEAIARQSAGDVIVAASAGVMALGRVAPFTLQVLEERGVECADLHSKPLTRAAQQAADIIVNMTGASAEGWLASGKSAEDWPVRDPYGEPLASYRKACDEIEVRLAEWTARLRARRAAPCGA